MLTYADRDKMMIGRELTVFGNKAQRSALRQRGAERNAMNTETPKNREPLYGAATCWVVEIETECWLAPWQGDPGRTLRLENAKRYKSQHAAECALRRARKFRPLVYAKIYQPNTMLSVSGERKETDAKH
jgi:hypothetical protein